MKKYNKFFCIALIISLLAFLPISVSAVEATTTPMTASIVGTSVAASGGGTVNKNRGQITNEELRTFFSANCTLLEDIATQLIPLHEETELYLIRRVNSQIVANDGRGESVDLGTQLTQQLQQYFDAVGTTNSPEILVRELFGEYLVVEFTFRLAVDHTRGIIYSTDAELQTEWENSGVERFDTDWSIFEYFMSAPPIELRWWEKLPAWLQWILRYICFGWIWMK